MLYEICCGQDHRQVIKLLPDDARILIESLYFIVIQTNTEWDALRKQYQQLPNVTVAIREKLEPGVRDEKTKQKTAKRSCKSH